MANARKTQEEQGVKVSQTIPAFVYRRLGSAAAGIVDAGEHWVILDHEAGKVRRQPKAGDEPDDVDKADHFFAIRGDDFDSGPRAIIEAIDLTIRRRDGTTETVHLDAGEKLDALFFGTGAISKFVTPYYCATLGPEYASDIIQAWLLEKDKAAVCHTPTSEDCSVTASSLLSMDGLLKKAFDLVTDPKRQR